VGISVTVLAGLAPLSAPRACRRWRDARGRWDPAAGAQRPGCAAAHAIAVVLAAALIAPLGAGVGVALFVALAIY